MLDLMARRPTQSRRKPFLFLNPAGLQARWGWIRGEFVAKAYECLKKSRRKATAWAAGSQQPQC